jgi:signal peptidase I
MSMRRKATSGLMLLVAFASWYFLAPRVLGGSTGYVSVARGVSMEPRIHAGDLALVRRASAYRVGDVVAINDTSLGHTVLHRVIGTSGARLTTRGDNNDFTDAFHPVAADVAGRMFLRIPAGGRALGLLRSKVALAVLLALALGIALSRTPRGDASAARRGAGARGGFGSAGARGNAGLAAAAACVAALGMLVAALSFARGGVVQQKTSYEQSARLDYRAPARDGAVVYGSDAARTGAPVYFSQSDKMSLLLKYSMTSTAPVAASGTVSLRAELRGDDGLRRAIALGGRARIASGTAAARATLDVSALRALLDDVQRLTGVTAPTYKLAILGVVDARATVGGRAVSSAFAPEFVFALDQYRMMPAGGAGAGAFAAAATDAVVTAVRAPGHVVLWRWHLAAGTARAAGTALALMGALVAAAAWRPLRRARSEGGAAWIDARYGRLIVDVAERDVAAHTIVVGSFEELVRLAQSYNRMMLRRRGEIEDEFFVEEDDRSYVFRAPAQPRDTAAPAGAAAPVADLRAELVLLEAFKRVRVAGDVR